MKTKIARNVEKLSNILRKDNILNDSINILLNNSRKYTHLKLRTKETKHIKQRPKAPHNTTQYLSRFYQENRDSQESLSITQMSLDHFNKENTYSIENFIITGGSLKGI